MGAYKNPKVTGCIHCRKPSRTDEEVKRNTQELVISLIVALGAFAMSYAVFGFEWLN